MCEYPSDSLGLIISVKVRGACVLIPQTHYNDITQRGGTIHTVEDAVRHRTPVHDAEKTLRYYVYSRVATPALNGALWMVFDVRDRRHGTHERPVQIFKIRDEKDE